MSSRNLSPQHMFRELALEHRPECAFKGRDKKAFDAWKKKTRPKIMATLGDWPERVEPNPRMLAEWEHDRLTKQKWVIDVGRHISATLLINFPEGMEREHRYPAILCCHGHGESGKEPVMGNDSSPELRDNIAKHNYNYGHQMAKAGFVTYAVDWIGFGERNDSNKPELAQSGRWARLVQHILPARDHAGHDIAFNQCDPRYGRHGFCHLPETG